jgi:two-component system, LuxR family, response regulator FixJ
VPSAKLHDLACLILDHHMPHMNGLELAEQLRREGALMPILLMTGEPTRAIIARAAEVGVQRVLQKPAEEQDLLDFIGKHAPRGGP